MRRLFLTFRALGTGLLLVLATLLLLPSMPAQAGTTLLCKGFTDCARKGYGNFGYAAVYRQMHWRMYGGHNCTNYAAYRMIKMGGPASRPWSGSGNASNWGIALASKTDRTPTVGSVAWWRGRNHVQIVEKVVDANTIVISEDHWGGDFNWAVVRRSSGHWPDGFIHIVDAPLAPSVAPSLPVAAQVGVPITGDPGVWPAGTTITYQWLAAGYPIAGATARTYVPGPADVGKWLYLRVMASKPGHRNAVAYPPNKTSPVAPGVLQSSGAPTVEGIAKVAGTLRATDPVLTPAAESASRQWLADGAVIPGATGPALALTAAVEGKRISVRFSAARPGYAPYTADSAATEAVGPEHLALTAPPRLTGRPLHGQQLTLDPGSVNVPGATVAYRWYQGGVMRREVTSASYLLGAGDLGKRVAVKVAWRKPGYPEVVRDLTSAVVRSASRPRVLSRHSRTLRLEIVAPGAPSIWGRAQIRLPSGTVRTGFVRGGEVRFPDLPVGAKQIRIEFGGNKYATPGAWTVPVTIRR